MSEINHARTVPPRHIMVKIPRGIQGFPLRLSIYGASIHASQRTSKGTCYCCSPVEDSSMAAAVLGLGRNAIFVPHDYPSTKEAPHVRDPEVKLLYRTSLGITLP